MIFKPHDYQAYTIKKMLDNPRMLTILDMGLGKTVSTLTTIDELVSNRLEVSKVLVIAPKKVATFTWEEEIEKWDHLKHLKLSKIVGTEKQRLKALYTDANIYTLGRDNVVWLIDILLKNGKRNPFDMLVVDESSSFKSPSSKRFKALKKLSVVTSRVILLTGTPASNSLLDLWSQMYLVDSGQRLGRTFSSYKNNYFKPGKRNRNVVFSYVPIEGAEQMIYDAISDVSMSLKAKDHLNMPERVDNIIKIELDAEARKKYDFMETNYILSLNDETITAATAGVVSNKLLQFANGSVYNDDGGTTHIHDAKLEALEEIVELSQGKPLMVFYNFKHDLERLQERFKELNPRTLQTKEDKADWDNGRIQMLLAHPASMGHGLNLQAGGNIIVWFGLNWSLELYQQANARLYRQGQKESVIIHHLVVNNSMDENVMEALQSKSVNQDKLIDAVKAKIESIKNLKK